MNLKKNIFIEYCKSHNYIELISYKDNDELLTVHHTNKFIGPYENKISNSQNEMLKKHFSDVIELITQKFFNIIYVKIYEYKKIHYKKNYCWQAINLNKDLHCTFGLPENPILNNFESWTYKIPETGIEMLIKKIIDENACNVILSKKHIEDIVYFLNNSIFFIITKRRMLIGMNQRSNAIYHDINHKSSPNYNDKIQYIFGQCILNITSFILFINTKGNYVFTSDFNKNLIFGYLKNEAFFNSLKPNFHVNDDI